MNNDKPITLTPDEFAARFAPALAPVPDALSRFADIIREVEDDLTQRGRPCGWVSRCVDPAEPGAMFLPDGGRGKNYRSDCPHYEGYWLCGGIGSVQCALGGLLPGIIWGKVCSCDGGSGCPVNTPARVAYSVHMLKDCDATTDKRFMRYDWTMSHGGVNLSEYETVYTGSITARDTAEEMLESIFSRLNLNHPLDYHARSLSVSDLVTLENGGTWFVDSVGFKRIN